jgi:long-chain acyl-CoA synthetase
LVTTISAKIAARLKEIAHCLMSKGLMMSFCQKLIEAAGARPDKVAMVMLGPNGAETTTFGEMLAQTRSLAYRLGREGVEFGDRVALIGENHPRWATAYLGVIYRGAVATPLDPEASVESLANFIDNSGSKLAFVSPAALKKFRAVCDRLGRRIPVVALRHIQEHNGISNYEEWARTPRPPEFDAAPPPAKPEDIAVLIYTSGTSAAPKGVPLTHSNIYAEGAGIQEAMRVSEREVVLGLLPLFHVYSQAVNLWLAMTMGARIVYIPALNSAEIERGLREGEVTTLLGVPRLWYLFHKKVFDAVRARATPVRWLLSAMMRVNGWMRDAFGINAGRLFFKRIHQAFGGRLRLAVSGGSSFDPEVAMAFHRLGFTILQGYGLTETSGAATVTRFEDNKIGSVGTPLEGVEVEIDEPDEEGVGEILIRGPIVMPGYWRNEEANREAFTEDGWFRSGDLGRFDNQGHLYVTGRKKDVIVLPSGKNVYPEEVEEHYARAPMVSEICVLGAPDRARAFAGAEKLLAVVVPDFDYLKSHRIANTREAITWELNNLGRELPGHQRLRDYIIRAEPLPRTSTRKVRRQDLRREIEASGELERQTREDRRVSFTPEDRALMDSPLGQAITDAVRRRASDVEEIYPQMNLELDLGFDSLARAEFFASIEHALGVEFGAEEAASALTVGEIVRLAEEKGASVEAKGASASLDWREILATAPADMPEARPILKRKPVTAPVVYALLRVAYFAARALLRLEVSGSEVFARIEPPYLICPNHQSYLDPIIISSAYPYRALKRAFHVGASGYFTRAPLSWLAGLINVVPIDADANLLGAMRGSAVGLRAGKILNIYPEGQRSFEGELQDFKNGAAILAAELNLPIVPVAIDGMYRIWPRGSARVHPAKVKVRFGEPIYAEAAPGVEREASYQEITARLKERIQRMLDEMRNQAE